MVNMQFMNAPFHPEASPERIRINADQFWMLKQEGAFQDFSKSELLDGELWGVPRQPDDEPESDAVVPIKLRVQDYEQLGRAGSFDAFGKTELVDGLVYRMCPQFRPHGFAKDELAYRLATHSGNLFSASYQSAIYGNGRHSTTLERT